jgi:glycosyltransferase involved in cell wall biosynthesis
MKILLLDEFFLERNEGGGSRFNEIVLLWEQEGHETTVLAGMLHYFSTDGKHQKYKGKYTYREQYSDKVTAIRCHVSGGFNKSFIGRLWAYFSFVFSSLYGGLFKAREKYDVIIVTSPPLFIGITGYLLSRIKRVPYVFEVRDLWPESAIDTGVVTNKFIIKLAYWLEDFLYRKAWKINVLTPAFRKKLIENKGVPPEKIFYIPNASDFKYTDHLMQNFDAAAFKKQLGWAGKTVVTYVGAHGVANHLIQVLETAALLRDTNLHFALIGDGMQKAWLKEQAQKMDLKNVEFIDSVTKTEVFKYILASDFGSSVLKKVETFKTVYSNKTFDYMSCKKPIFMLIDGLSRELVEEVGCGAYVEAENPAAYAQTVRNYLAKGESVWKEEGVKGYEYAKEKFDRTLLSKKFLEHLHR